MYIIILLFAVIILLALRKYKIVIILVPFILLFSILWNPKSSSSFVDDLFYPTDLPSQISKIYNSGDKNQKKSNFYTKDYYAGPYGQTSANNYTEQIVSAVPKEDYILNSNGEIITMQQQMLNGGNLDDDNEPAVIDPLTVVNIKRQNYKKDDLVVRTPSVPDEYWRDFIIPDAPWNDISRDLKRHGGEIMIL